MRYFSSEALPRGVRSPVSLLVMGGAVAGMAAFCIQLWPEWRGNSDLAHAFFQPLVFLFLLAESRRTGPLRWIARSKFWTAVQMVGLFGSVALFGVAGLFAAALGWSHALVLFLQAGALVALLLAGWTILADERVRTFPCNWTNFSAIFLWMLVVPLPTGTYARLTLALQGWVTGGVINILAFLGIPARQHGNVIELAHTTVGVEEACSGVRSLISCVYAGFFFAAWMVRRPRRRLALIVAAPVIALAMNMVRSLTLTLLANQGVDIGGTWHDATSYGILGIVSLALAALAYRWETEVSPVATKVVSGDERAAPRFATGLFVSGLLSIGALGLFFHAHARSEHGAAVAETNLAARMPERPAGWNVRTASNLYQFAGVLQTDQLFQRTYLRPEPDRTVTDVTVYFAHWPAGKTSVSRVAAHTPDACWPGSGWIPIRSGTPSRAELARAGLALAPAEYRIFSMENGYRQYVWFWHVFDGRVIDYRDPYSLSALLDIAWRYGFRRQGSQYFIRLSSNRPWAEIGDEPLVREILTGLKPAGL